jgi:hypothetical protein
MAEKPEMSSRIDFRDPATSTMESHRLELGVSSAPPEAGVELPERYNLPLLELLVVDPQYVFISWEVTTQQVEDARLHFGDDLFNQRRLVLRLLDASSGETLMAQELYGELGRWFIGHTLAGRLVKGSLCFRAGTEYFPLVETGKLELPRDYTLEPERFDEMSIEYGFGPTGELVILELNPRCDLPWPELVLPHPAGGLQRTLEHLGMRRIGSAAVPILGARLDIENLPSSHGGSGVTSPGVWPPGAGDNEEENK